MTLFKQILVVILLSLVVNLAGVLWLSFDSTRDYLTHQLESDLENTSTSLGMSLLPFIEANDKVMIESTMKAYFDSGYYQSMTVTLLANNEQIQQSIGRNINNVPQWFIDFNAIDVPSSSTTLTSGWMQVANLEIVGHPGFAYVKLWQSFIDFLSWFAGLTLVVVAIASIGIKRILKPIHDIRKKAVDIQNQQFGDPIALPNTFELKSVVGAINAMSERIQAKFAQDSLVHNQLKEQAFKDATTGLANRAYLNRQLASMVTQKEEGYLFFISLHGLEEVKLKHGFVLRDELIVQAAHFIEQCTGKINDSVNCRISANEFALLCPNIDQHQSMQLSQHLRSLFDSQTFCQHFGHDKPFFIGAAQILGTNTVSDILSAVDSALLKSKSTDDHVFIASEISKDSRQLQRHEIKQTILQAIELSAISFVRQPVYHFHSPNGLFHYEIFAKLHAEKAGIDVPAITFISILDEYDLGTEFDKKAIEMSLSAISDATDTIYTINLSASALNSQSFIHWLLERLRMFKYKRCVCFEISEESIIYNKDNIYQLVAGLKSLHVGFGVDRVARNFSSLAYLKDVQPDYVKIDPVYTHMALADSKDAYFVSSLCSAIHNLNIKVIASHVESAEQLSEIEALQFDGYQGYIHRPEEFSI